MPTPPSTPNSSPSHAANSIRFHFDRTAQNQSPASNNSPQEQTAFISLGDGELTLALLNDRTEVREEIAAMLPAQPPVRRTAPPPFLALLSVDTGPFITVDAQPPVRRTAPPPPLALLSFDNERSVTVGYRTAPYPMSSIDIKKDFLEMRALNLMLELSASGSTAWPSINTPKLATLMHDIKSSLAWQSAQEAFDKAEERCQIVSGMSMTDEPSPSPDFIFSIQDQIDLTKHQISLMKEFNSRINSIKPDDLIVTALILESEEANNLNDNVPFIEDFEDWNYAVSREKLSISFSQPQNPTTLMASAIQFWGEILQITTLNQLESHNIIIEDDDWLLKSIDLVAESLHQA